MVKRCAVHAPTMTPTGLGRWGDRVANTPTLLPFSNDVCSPHARKLWRLMGLGHWCASAPDHRGTHREHELGLVVGVLARAPRAPLATPRRASTAPGPCTLSTLHLGRCRTGWEPAAVVGASPSSSSSPCPCPSCSGWSLLTAVITTTVHNVPTLRPRCGCHHPCDQGLSGPVCALLFEQVGVRVEHVPARYRVTPKSEGGDGVPRGSAAARMYAGCVD